MKDFTRTALLIAFLAFAASTAFAQDYEIKITRAHKAGDTFRVASSGSHSMRMTMEVNGRRGPERKETFDVALEGVVKIIQVDAAGDDTELSVDVEKCEKTTGSTKTELIPKGAVLIATAQGDETIYKLKEGQLSEEAVEALKVVLPMSAADEGTDDEVFGTTERKKVGDSWPINAEVAAKRFEAMGEKIKPDAIKGTAKLVSAKEHNGVPCLEIKVVMTVRGLIPGTDEMPPGVEVRDAVVQTELWGMFPQDTAMQPVAERMMMQVEGELGGQAGPEKANIKSKISGKRTMKADMTPVK